MPERPPAATPRPPPPAAPGAVPIHALLVEDHPGDARLLRELLRDARGGDAIVVEHVERLAAALDCLRQADAGIDVVLLDLSLPDSQGLETFVRLHRHAPSVPVVVLSGLDDERVALRAVQEGAQDYLVKGRVDGDTLVRALRYALERQRLEAQRQALTRQQDEFLAHISHDLRTPIATIKVALRALRLQEPEGTAPARRRLLGTVELAADELARLVEDLLEMTRLQAGRVDMWRERVDLREVARRAARAIEPLAETRGQRVELLLPPEPLLAEVDAGRLGRVLGNLLANAHHYGREGGIIRLSLRRAEGEARLAVADDGPGIPASEHARIFERFYRGPTCATRPRGTGLGLPIVRALVDLHGGRVWVESAPGAGATFHVTLPTSPTRRPVPRTLTPASPEPQPP